MPVVGVLLALLVLTQTRAAWAGALIILMTYAGWVDRRYLLGLLVMPFLLLIPIVAERISDLGQGSEYTGRMQSAADTLNSYAWRELMWESALKDAEDTPLLGKGLSSFRGNTVRFFPLPLPEGGIDAHSGYIQSFYENGYVGFFCLLFMYLSVLWRAWIGRKVDRKGSFLVISIIVANMCALYSDNLFGYLSVDWYFWSFLGIVFAKWDLALEERRQAKARCLSTMTMAGAFSPERRNTVCGNQKRIA
jgi:O-antigen ligase